MHIFTWHSLVFATIFLHVATSDLFSVDADATETTSGSMISGDYPINFDKVKKDISALLLPKIGTTLFADTNLDSTVLFSLVSLIVLCSSSTHHYAFYCNHVSPHGLYGPASGIGRIDIFFSGKMWL